MAGEHQPSYTRATGRDGDVAHAGVAADAAGEPDRPVPSRRVGEHQIRVGRPVRELPELRRPGGTMRRRLDQVAGGRVRSMPYRQWSQLHVVGIEGLDGGPDLEFTSPSPDLRHQLRTVVAHEPCVKRRARIRGTSAVEHDPVAGPCQQQPGGTVPG